MNSKGGREQNKENMRKMSSENYGIEKYILWYKYKDENFSKKISEVYLKEIDEIENDFILTL